MRRKTCLLFIFIICIEQISCLGLKTNCYVEGTSSQAICTCGGEYKWGEHGGGRFGVDLFDQIIWSRGSENIQDLKTITYEDCNSNSIFTLDLDDKYPNVNLIEFKNSGLGCSLFFSVNLNFIKDTHIKISSEYINTGSKYLPRKFKYLETLSLWKFFKNKNNYAQLILIKTKQFYQ